MLLFHLEFKKKMCHFFMFLFFFPVLYKFLVISQSLLVLIIVSVVVVLTTTHTDTQTHSSCPLSCSPACLSLSLSLSGGLEPLASDWFDSPGGGQDHRSVSLLPLWIFLLQTKPRPPTCPPSHFTSSARQQNRRSFASCHSSEGQAKLLLIIESGAHRRGHAACSRCIA